MVPEKVFYATCIDGPRHAFLLGPFSAEAQCRAWAYCDPADGGDPAKHHQLREAAEKADCRSVFYAFGMASMKGQPTYPPGKLNEMVGLDPRAIGCVR